MITSPFLILSAALRAMTWSANVTLSRMNTSMASQRPFLASASGTLTSTFDTSSFSHRIAFPIEIDRGRHDDRYSICGERTCDVRCRLSEFCGGVVYDPMTL